MPREIPAAWLNQRDAFRDAATRARKAGAPALVDRAWGIADDASRDVLEQRDADGRFVRLIPNNAAVKRDELRVNQLRYMAGTADPVTYGPKQQLEVSGNVFITELLVRMDDAIARLNRPPVIDVVPAPLPMPAPENKPAVREPAEPKPASLPKPVERGVQVVKRPEREELVLAPGPSGPPARPVHHASYTDYLKSDRNANAQAAYAAWRGRMQKDG